MPVLPSLLGDKVGLFDHDRFRGDDLPFASLLRPADSLSTLHPGGCPRCVQDSVLPGGLGVRKVAFACHWIPPCLLGATPPRSRRAALPHRAPASGRDAQASEDACRTQSRTCDREHPALRPAPGMLDHVPLGPLPSLHLLRRSLGATVGRRLPRYYDAVRLPAPVHHGRAPQVHRADLALPHQARCRASRVPHTVLRYMQRSPTPPGPSPPHHTGVDGVAFRVCGARRHPGVARFRGSLLCLSLPLSTLR
jgi:hypothetical protein